MSIKCTERTTAFDKAIVRSVLLVKITIEVSAETLIALLLIVATLVITAN